MREPVILLAVTAGVVCLEATRRQLLIDLLLRDAFPLGECRTVRQAGLSQSVAMALVGGSTRSVTGHVVNGQLIERSAPDLDI